MLNQSTQLPPTVYANGSLGTNTNKIESFQLKNRISSSSESEEDSEAWLLLNNKIDEDKTQKVSNKFVYVYVKPIKVL